MLFRGGRRDAELLAAVVCVAEAVGEGVEDDISSSIAEFSMHPMVSWCYRIDVWFSSIVFEAELLTKVSSLLRPGGVVSSERTNSDLCGRKRSKWIVTIPRYLICCWCYLSKVRSDGVSCSSRQDQGGSKERCWVRSRDENKGGRRSVMNPKRVTESERAGRNER